MNVSIAKGTNALVLVVFSASLWWLTNKNLIKEKTSCSSIASLGQAASWEM